MYFYYQEMDNYYFNCIHWDVFGRVTYTMFGMQCPIIFPLFMERWSTPLKWVVLLTHRYMNGISGTGIHLKKPLPLPEAIPGGHHIQFYRSTSFLANWQSFETTMTPRISNSGFLEPWFLSFLWVTESIIWWEVFYWGTIWMERFCKLKLKGSVN